jgi:hypothetical protein
MIGDFVLQPYWLVLAKRNGWPGLLIHVGVVTFVTAIFLWVSSVPNWWVWVIALFIGHLFIDQFRTFVFVDNTKGKGLWLLLLDQLAHLILIALLAWWATGWTPSNLTLLISAIESTNQQRLLAYLVGLAVLIGVMPVLEVEIVTTLLYYRGSDSDGTVKVDMFDRVLGSIERIIATFLILVGYGLLAPLMFIPRLALMIHQGEYKASPTTVITKVIVSLISAVIVGFVLRLIPPPVLF